jgi:hypothetical protein
MSMHFQVPHRVLFLALQEMRIDPYRDRHIGVAQVFRDFADWPLEQNQHARVGAIRSRLEARIDGNEPDRVSNISLFCGFLRFETLILRVGGARAGWLVLIAGCAIVGRKGLSMFVETAEQDK